MFSKILIPLDGSSFSEAAVPFSINLAMQMHSRITLLHVIEKNPPKSVHGEHHLAGYNEASEYLENLKNSSYPKGIEVDCHIHPDDGISVEKAIAKHKEEISADLILMTTHGWGGLKEIFFGNIAQQIFNTGTIPVLFIPPSLKNPSTDKWPEKIILPLDGTGEHEKGGEAAAEITKSCGSELTLAFIIPTLNTLPADKNALGVLLPGATREVLEMQEDVAEEYLNKKMGEFRNMGINVKTEICRGDPALGINRIVEKENIDLIVLGTHGRVGISAFWSGSVGAKITNRAKAAILFVPIGEDH